MKLSIESEEKLKKFRGLNGVIKELKEPKRKSTEVHPIVASFFKNGIYKISGYSLVQLNNNNFNP